MTAISPLQNIHKKGLFGDHQKKNENEILHISEVKNLTILQIVQYKKSNIILKNINIDGLHLPLQNLKVSSNNDTRILWNSPNTWLVVSNKEVILQKINDKFDNKNFAITDISHSRAVLQIKGDQVKEVLKKGCPLNFNEFRENSCAGSTFHGINFVIDCINDNKQIFNLITLRSFGESLYHHITDASLEYGYSGS
jgi:sarcosine oxidase subunit gamma